MARIRTYPSTPNFAVDPSSLVLGSGRQIDWANVRRPDSRIDTITATANAAVGATAISVAALTVAIPVFTILYFGGTKFARTSAPRNAGDTNLAVEALVTQVNNTDTATLTYEGKAPRTLPAGTVVANSNGKLIKRSATAPAIGLLATTASEESKSDALTGYGMITGGAIYENLLPDADGSGNLASAIKTELNAAGTGFSWEKYTNSAIP